MPRTISSRTSEAFSDEEQVRLRVALQGTRIRHGEHQGGAGTVRDLTDDPSIRDHWDIWSVSGQIASDHPVLGTGPETFPDVFPLHSHEVLPADRVAYFDFFRIESPHNLFLAIASGAGVLALAAFVWFLLALATTAVRTGRNNDDAAPVLFAVLIAGAGFVVTNSFITADLSSSWLLWVLAGAAMGVAGDARLVRSPRDRTFST